MTSRYDRIRQIGAGADFIENGYLKVRAAHTMLDIYDKTEEHWYYGQNLLVESAEAGDCWESSPTWIPSETVLSNRFEQTVEILETGPVRAVMKVSFVMDVPARMTEGRRSAERTEMPVTYTVALYAAARRAEVRLTIHNTARDHQISLRMEPRLSAASIRAQNTFCVLERPAFTPFDPKETTAFPKPLSQPFHEWLSVRDDTRGLAFAAKGLYDYESGLDAYYGYPVLSMRLLRGVGNMGRCNIKPYLSDGQYSFPMKDAQCLGEQVIEYAWIPYSVRDEAELSEEIQAFLYPPVGHVVHVEPAGEQESAMPFSWKETNIRFSAFKRAEDSDCYVLRLYENEGVCTRAEVDLNGFDEATLCSLNEAPLEALPICGGKVTLSFGPYKIVTLLLRRAAGA
jgi:alpha-mannosidase